MALFKMLWLRRLVRRHTNPIPQDTAELWKRRLSIAYGLIAWNAFGYVCYMFYTGRGDWAKYYGFKSEEEMNLTPAQFYAKTLNIEKGKIIRYNGFTKVNEETFDYSKDKKAEN